MESIRKRGALFSLIIAGEAIFFLPFVLVRIFRPIFLEVFKITNTELGNFFSVYGIVAMISYFFGGILADRFSARNLMFWALTLTALGGVVLATIPSGYIMYIIYGFWGVTTILLFWSALIRTTREWGGDEFQGRAFGWLEGGRGAAAALIGSIALILYATIRNEEGGGFNSAQQNTAFRYVILGVSLLVFISGILVRIYVPANRIKEKSNRLIVSDIKVMLKNRSVIILSIIVLCAYIGYKITDDFSLYANEVLGFGEVKSAVVGTSALWVRAFVAIMAGVLADKSKGVIIIHFCFVFGVIGGGIVYLGILEKSSILVMLNLFMVMIAVYGVRGLYFALIHEAGLPIEHTGKIVGVISIIGFTPDIFMSPLMGYLLDSNPGAIGHRNVFLVLAIFSLLGFIASMLFKNTIYLKNKEK